MISEAPVIICGFPSPAQDYTESSLDFNTYLDVRKPSVYALRAKGVSMTGAGIYPEDIILVDKSKRAYHGSLVVACIDGCFTLKRLFLKPQVILHPENPDFDDIILGKEEELTIFGVVTAVVRKL
ncbi:translesion error-prone DNA polymerase V autoproteolytic subunit [Bullifex sp.]|uniref:LexA family protein n=1 Tax=Bullifex sp. TaxID=2815808 RepID=UPI002A7FDA2B|nr:translesion error-prone DNA polymerase V autoproteolytic subunit [Bullifex sp.]MDY4066229.1 translesion error-prone DNA polymerase V autoproteolytic subunit [Bullifex sp.]